MTSEAEVSADDRVSVKIKDHQAVVTGNSSAPSASSTHVSLVESIVAEKASITELNAEKARINNLVADNVSIHGEITASNAKIGDIEADNVTIHDSLNAMSATIAELSVESLTVEAADIRYAKVDSLRATDAKVYNLEATYTTISGKLEAAEANITTLTAKEAAFETTTADNFTATNASISSLSAKEAAFETATANSFSAVNADISSVKADYAKIDFANIGDAAIRRVFATTGMIENLMINQGKITGDLAAVRIDGDLITANTIHANRIVIKGEDGLYYELNTSGLSPEALKEIEDDLEDRDLDPTTELNNRLHGSNIIAQSITANKIFVDDLYAFGATIGGFDIEEHSLHSHSKSSLSSTAPGVFMDDSGQLNIGDNDDYIKYTKIENTSDYRLDISAAVVTLGTNKTNVEAEILSSSEQITNQADQIAELSNLTSQELNSVRDAIGVNEEAIDSVRTALNSAQDELDTMTGFIKVDSAAATMELGKNDSPFGVRITNSEIDFKIDRADGETDVPAYIGISEEDSKSRFYVERASFEEEIAFENFVLVKHVVDGKTNVGIIRRGWN